MQEIRRELENEALDARLSSKFDSLQNDMELMRYSILLDICPLSALCGFFKFPIQIRVLLTLFL